MNPTRNGKIGRLPMEIRERLNRRLQDGQQGKKFVAWLNTLPEVRAIVAEESGGRPVREQNLSEREAERRWNRKIDIGLEVLSVEMKHNPEALAAF